MKRSKFLTFFSLLIFWMAFSSIAFNFGYERHFVTNISSGIYAISALIAGISLWKVFPWTSIAVLIWLGISIANLLVYFFVNGKGSYSLLIGQILIVLVLFKPLMTAIKEHVNQS